jgi:hypothetical protein
MLPTSIQKRLFNKAHIFEANAAFCSRCGCSTDDALDTPFRCAGESAASPTTNKPKTLSEAIDYAENP